MDNEQEFRNIVRIMSVENDDWLTVRRNMYKSMETWERLKKILKLDTYYHKVMGNCIKPWFNQ